MSDLNRYLFSLLFRNFEVHGNINAFTKITRSVSLPILYRRGVSCRIISRFPPSFFMAPFDVLVTRRWKKSFHLEAYSLTIPFDPVAFQSSHQIKHWNATGIIRKH
jgi:hypothetical protein